MKNDSRNRSAFTLFELLVVICILAILCGLAIARFDVKRTAEGAWGAVHESAYKAAKTALAKALAEHPAEPPTLQELAHQIDTKKTIYVTDCDNAENPSPTTNNGLCLGIDINDNATADPGEVFGAPYLQSDCENIAQNQGDEICCLERPFFDKFNLPSVSFFSAPF
ncbi:MAG: type II secretion system GspH family protein [Holophagales bacterium]|nr:type II secretion system GspH family protein [Holophagales bacterium]